MKAKYAHFQVKETKEFIASRPVLQECKSMFFQVNGKWLTNGNSNLQERMKSFSSSKHPFLLRINKEETVKEVVETYKEETVKEIIEKKELLQTATISSASQKPPQPHRSTTHVKWEEIIKNINGTCGRSNSPSDCMHNLNRKWWPFTGKFGPKRTSCHPDGLLSNGDGKMRVKMLGCGK